MMIWDVWLLQQFLLLQVAPLLGRESPGRLRERDRTMRQLLAESLQGMFTCPQADQSP